MLVGGVNESRGSSETVKWEPRHPRIGFLSLIRNLPGFGRAVGRSLCEDGGDRPPSLPSLAGKGDSPRQSRYHPSLIAP